MCIAKSVGQSGRKDLTDVMVFQILFNLNIDRFPEPKPAKLKPKELKEYTGLGLYTLQVSRFVNGVWKVLEQRQVREP